MKHAKKLVHEFHEIFTGLQQKVPGTKIIAFAILIQLRLISHVEQTGKKFGSKNGVGKQGSKEQGARKVTEDYTRPSMIK